METLEKSVENKKDMKLKIINKHKELVAKNQYDIARRISRFMVAKRETLGIGDSDWRLANILEELGVKSYSNGLYNRRFVL